jgi:ubiquitin carboxyl-terminal hydrolase 34
LKSRSLLTKSRETRELTGLLFAQVTKIAASTVDVDRKILQQLCANPEHSDFEIFSTQFLNNISGIVRKEDPYAHQAEGIPELANMATMFLNALGGSMLPLHDLVRLHSDLLSRFPRKTLDYLPPTCGMVETLARYAHGYLEHDSTSEDELAAEQSRQTLVLGYRFFIVVSHALATALEKHVNHLNADTAKALLNSLTTLYEILLQSNNGEMASLVEAKGAALPDISAQYVADAVTMEWRVDLLAKMIRSRQMQLRVAAATILCGDLVNLWKRHQEFGEDAHHLEYLRHVSRFLIGTELIDYIFGPTCHPEITQESFNIIGFLMVTKTFSIAHTDLFWQTVTSSQDPRVAQAVCRMMQRVVSFMTPDDHSYLCEKLCALPMDGFVPYVRDLCSSLISAMQQTRPGHSPGVQSVLPYRLCLRLLQQSSATNSDGSATHMEIYSFAAQKLRDLLTYASAAIRTELRLICLNDIAAKTATTSGSLTALYTLLRPTMPQALLELIEQYDFATVLVDEIASATSNAQRIAPSSVYGAPIGTARRDFVFQIISYHGDLLDSQLGRRLWNLLVGRETACQDDRVLAWQGLNTAAKEQGFEGRFLNTCVQEYLPDLPPALYCDGTLDFLRSALNPLMTEPDVFLDDANKFASCALELLWQMILTSHRSIEREAIRMLVSDIYIDSEAIRCFPVTRVRTLHFGLLNRCLQQMETAAQQMRVIVNGRSSGDDPMVLSTNDDLQSEQRLKFSRSLAVLRAFLAALQGRHEFAAPDLRPMMSTSPNSMEGESAELKYQSFDGNIQTDIKPLEIGRKNTAASLLASLRDATGFDNYRVFYRGSSLTPSEEQVCRSLEDLQIHDGLLLVRREENLTSSFVKVKPGASKLQIEILGHFNALWEYLSLDEVLAEEASYSSGVLLCPVLNTDQCRSTHS